jgi:hypothetical protein
MLLADDTRVEHTGSRIERIHSRIDAKLSNAAREHSRGVKMREGRGRGRIGQIVGRNVDSLPRRISTEFF